MNTVTIRSSSSGPPLTGTPGDALVIAPDGQSVTSEPIATLPAVTGANNTELLQVIAGAWTAAGLAPFLKHYYVNGSFVGVSTGASANPFASIAAAVGAAPAEGACLEFPPASTIVEGITLPAAGEWQLYASRSRSVNINGSLAMTPTVASQYTLTNVTLSSTVTGVASGGLSQFICEGGARVNGAVSLTGTWNCILRGQGAAGINSFTGLINAALTVAGVIAASFYVFGGAITFGDISEFANCKCLGGCTSFSSSVPGTALRLSDCTFTSAMTFTGAAGTALKVLVDSWTMANLLAVGVTLVNATLSTLDSQGATGQVAVTGNTTITLVQAKGVVPGLYEILGVLDLAANGTSGVVQQSVLYTDQTTGSVQTVPIYPTGINIATDAVGKEVRGAVQINPKSGTAIQLSTTGIVTIGTGSLFGRAIARKVD